MANVIYRIAFRNENYKVKETGLNATGGVDVRENDLGGLDVVRYRDYGRGAGETVVLIKRYKSKTVAAAKKAADKHADKMCTPVYLPEFTKGSWF